MEGKFNSKQKSSENTSSENKSVKKLHTVFAPDVKIKSGVCAVVATTRSLFGNDEYLLCTGHASESSLHYMLE